MTVSGVAYQLRPLVPRTSAGGGGVLAYAASERRPGTGAGTPTPEYDAPRTVGWQKAGTAWARRWPYDGDAMADAEGQPRTRLPAKKEGILAGDLQAGREGVHTTIEPTTVKMWPYSRCPGNLTEVLAIQFGKENFLPAPSEPSSRMQLVGS